VRLEERQHSLHRLDRCQLPGRGRRERRGGGERRGEEGSGLRGWPRCCPPPWVPRRLEAGSVPGVQQSMGEEGAVRVRGRVHECRRGGKERQEGRGSAGVEAKQRSRLIRRDVWLALERDRAESSRERGLERRDAPV